MRMSNESSVVKRNDGSFEVQNGEALIWTTKPSTLRASEVRFVLPANVALLVENYKGVVTARNLFDKGGPLVMAHIRNHNVKIGVATEFRWASEIDHIIKANNRDLLPRRRSKVNEVPSVGFIQTSDFSLVSINMSSAVYRSMFNSPDEEDHALSQRILKTFAAFSVVTTPRGPYVAPSGR